MQIIIYKFGNSFGKKQDQELIQHRVFDSVKRLVAYVMLNFAGIGGGNLLVNTKRNKEGCKHAMSIVDLMRQLLALIGKADKAVVVDGNVAPFF